MVAQIDINAIPAGPEMNALVAEHVMGLQVLGEANCACPEGDWYISDAEPQKNWGHMMPVYLQQCLCHLHEKETDELHERLFGHLMHGCLDVVPHWSTSIVAAWKVWEWAKQDKERWVKFVWALSGAQSGIHSLCYELNPLAICRAAWKAKGAR